MKLVQSFSTLRDRRRLETAHEIQIATLGLIRKHGFTNVSSEMIAAEAGISKRTFFNYYTNKEAAAVGPSTGFDEKAMARFAMARGPVVEDLTDLLRDMVHAGPTRKETIRTIDEILIGTPSLLPAFRASLNIIVDQMTDLLTQRLGPGRAATAASLAELVGIILIQAFRLWGHDDRMTLDDAVNFLKEQLIQIGDLLVQPSSAKSR